MRYSTFFKILFIFSLLFLQSCASRKSVAYLQDIDKANTSSSTTSYEPILKNDDLLSIIVSADAPELTHMFNVPQIQGNYKVAENQDGIKTYLIDNNGEIVFPNIGKIKLAGLSRSQAVQLLVDKIKPYITKNPTINLRILNFKFSVLGEVNRPGSHTINSERVTLLEAIANAGDLTIYGKRDNILLIREKEGNKIYNRIDITQSDFINSEFYYLTQNDVIVVEPNKTRVNASAFGPNVTAIISATSVVISLIILLTR
jgi:polysaccharide export outer membrane protein